LYVPVTVPVIWAETADVATVKGPETKPAETVTVEGTCTAGLSLARLTVAPPSGAVLLSDTVPDVLPGPMIAVGLRERDATTTGMGFTMSDTETCWGEFDAPPAEIVMVAL
jgi:hypothetical protein